MAARKQVRAKLPAKFTDAKVRVNEKGKVEILIRKNPLGDGGRFAKCVESVEARGGAADPRAVCAAAGRKKYGAKKFQAMATAGRKRARNPRNGYVIYPDSVGKMKLSDARKYAKKHSREDPGEIYRIENVDTEKTVARYRNGQEV